MRVFKLYTIIGTILAMVWSHVIAMPQYNERVAFYNIMAGNNISDIDAELIKIQESTLKEKEGFTGALLMKKAGLLHKAKDKLKYFKEGRIKLETALQQSPENTELHFLRLTIEEHAPRIVKYKSDIPGDKEQVVKHFKQLPAATQDAIRSYSKTSAILKPEDF